MGKVSITLKAAGGAIATTVAILTALRENPQLADGLNQTIEKLKSATNSDNPKIRFDGKIKAIEACADAVEETFPDATEPRQWRRQARTFRMRAELAWSANHGKQRRRAMRSLNEETASFLEQVNQRLVDMTNETGPKDELTAAQQEQHEQHEQHEQPPK